MSLQESEIREHLKDHPQRSESEASGPKTSIGLVSCLEMQQGTVYGFGFSFFPREVLFQWSHGWDQNQPL